MEKDIKNESGDTKRWSSIVIKSNGDIVFTPSEEGVIKLGGEEANLAVLCEKATVAKPGLVTCPGGITDTAPTGSGDVVRIVGYMVDDTFDLIYFCPDTTWVQLV
jgi:hypothetical protein